MTTPTPNESAGQRLLTSVERDVLERILIAFGGTCSTLLVGSVFFDARTVRNLTAKGYLRRRFGSLIVTPEGQGALMAAAQQ